MDQQQALQQALMAQQQAPDQQPLSDEDRIEQDLNAAGVGQAEETDASPAEDTGAKQVQLLGDILGAIKALKKKNV